MIYVFNILLLNICIQKLQYIYLDLYYVIIDIIVILKFYLAFLFNR